MPTTNANGDHDRCPLFYDNYFVPRGYAFIAAQLNGTAFSTGCPTARRPDRHRRLQGRRRLAQRPRPGLHARPTAPRAEATPTGTTASRRMIGKSYDGTFANGVAATGVEGLKTIVPI